jgi:hypothetical protein
MDLLKNLSLDVNITVQIPLNGNNVNWNQNEREEFINILLVDTNQWSLMFESDVLIIWSTVYSGLALFCVGFACYKLFVRIKGQTHTNTLRDEWEWDNNMISHSNNWI